jgi:hypothetical protein
MKAEDVKILRQLSPEAQEKVKLKLNVSELFACADFLNENEQPEQKIITVKQETPVKQETSVKQETPVKHEKPVTVRKVRIKEVERDAKDIKEPAPEAVAADVAVAAEQAGGTAVKKESNRKLPLYCTAKEIKNTYGIKEKTVLEWQELGLLKVHHKRNQVCYYERKNVLKIRRDIKNKKIAIDEWQGFSQKIVL